LFTLGGLGLIVRNFNPEAGMTVYRGAGAWLLALAAALGVGLLAGAIGLFLGLNGAGQKRNTQSGLAWMGFFLSAGVITAALVVAAFFVFTRAAM
jgi:hypothetical protein